MCAPLEQFALSVIFASPLVYAPFLPLVANMLYSALLILVMFALLGAICSIRVMLLRSSLFLVMVNATLGLLMAILVMCSLRSVLPFALVSSIVFLVILMLNYSGLLPFVLALTAHLGIALALSVMVNLGVLLRSVQRHRLLFLRSFLPVDVPLVIVGLMVPIELVSYLLKVATLGIRLFANMTSGHILLVIVSSFALTLVLNGVLGIVLVSLGLALVILLVILMLLEVMVCLIQALVFVLLSALYIADGDAAH